MFLGIGIGFFIGILASIAIIVIFTVKDCDNFNSETEDVFEEADSERPDNAEWIPDVYEFNHCSKCSYEMDDPEYTTPYCPNCGAKMEH